MKASASILGGLCVLEDQKQRQLVNVVDMSTLAPETAHLVCGAIEDWEVIEAPDREALLRDVRDRHLRARGLANIEACLGGVSARLQKKLLGEVEDLLKTLEARDQLAAMMLRAPLASTENLAWAVKECLSDGLAATAALLEQVRESQPLLRRFVDRWLSLPDQLFAAFPGGRQQAWRMGVFSGSVLETLRASTFDAVERAWAKLVFGLGSPVERARIAQVSKAVAMAMFPDHGESRMPAQRQRTPDREPEDSSEERREIRPRAQAALERAMKQVNAIAAAVAQGHDAKARRYLDDLVAAQTAYSGGTEHAVKSLCNIAHQCAEMFRTDFEYECLQTAITIRASDAWTLVQLADHFKRVGRFDDAIEMLRQAEAFGEDVVAKSSLADVYVQMERFPEALTIYKSIPGADQDSSIRQAKADALRRWGHLDDASHAYDCMIREGLGTHRTLAGLAEIAKRQGRVGEARDIYRQILADEDLDESSVFVYHMSIANVLLRTGELAEAYRRFDEAVQRRPFSRQARAFRAAVAGLLGKADTAIDDLPYLGQTKAFNEWVSEYVRGLLLLMLDRHGDARKALLRKAEEKFLDKDASAVLRLGAAVCFLQEREGIENASNILAEVPEMKDAFADTIRAALQYHVAVALRQDAEITRLEKKLMLEEDEDLKALVMAIRRTDWTEANRLEIRALLRLAS